MITLGNNVDGGLTGGENFHLATDSRGKTYLAFLFRENSTLMVRWFLKSQFTLISGRNYSIPTANLTAQCTPAIVDALTATDDPEGVANQWSGGPASQYVTGLTNLGYVPLKFSVAGSVTLASINAATGTPGVTPPNPNAVKKAFTVAANPDGTITVKDIQVGDLVALDGGTAVAATETSYTTGTLKDGLHTIVVTAKGTTYYYDPASLTATTKIALLSAPLDFAKENPLLTGAILLGVVLLIAYVFVPMSKGEPVFNGIFEGNNGKNAKIVKLKSNRKRMSLAA